MGLFNKPAKSRSSGSTRSYPKSFAGWEAPSTFATVADSMELQAEFGALLAGRNLDDINGAEFDNWAHLVRERNNPGDYAAVCIWVRGHFIGCLDQATTGKYVIEMNDLDSQELNLMVPAHLWAQHTKTCLADRMTLSLSLVGAVRSVNFSPKRAFTILPPGDEIALEDFENYVEPLYPFISTGKAVPVALAMVEERSSPHAYLDKKTYVGRALDTQVELIIPLVRTAVSRKLIPVARGLLTGSNTRNDLSIMAGNTGIVGTSWVPTHNGGY